MPKNAVPITFTEDETKYLNLLDKKTIEARIYKKNPGTLTKTAGAIQ